MRIIVCSSKNIASMNIREHLLENHIFKDCGMVFDNNPVFKHKSNLLITSDKGIVFINGLDVFRPELFIFASSHKSTSGKPCFSAHPTGLFNNDNSVGGKPFELSFCNAIANSFAVKNFIEFNSVGFPVVYEATHHGPFTSHPSVFVEVGSTVKEWKDLNACSITANVCFNLLDASLQGESVIGFGGQHYSQEFTELSLDEGYNFGHICPRYQIANLNETLIKQMIGRTVPKPALAVIDKKGCNRKEWIKSILKDNNIDILQI